MRSVKYDGSNDSMNGVVISDFRCQARSASWSRDIIEHSSGVGVLNVRRIEIFIFLEPVVAFSPVHGVSDLRRGTRFSCPCWQPRSMDDHG